MVDAIRNGANARAAQKAAHEKWTTALEEALLGAKRLDVLVETTITDTGKLAAYAAARTVRHAGGHKTAVSKTTEVTPPSIIALTAVTATPAAA